MNIKNFPKTHYEHACDYLNTQIGLTSFLKEVSVAVGDDPEYTDFGTYLMESSILKASDSEANSSFLINILFHIYLMKMNHEKIYYTTPQLAVKLAQTDINVDSHFLKSPFREIYIQIDPGLFTVSDPQGAHPVRGFYVFLKENKDKNVKEIRIMASAILKNSEDIPFNDTLFYYKIYFEPGKIKEQVKSSIEKNVKNKLDDLFKFGGISNINHIEEFTYFVINILLYITSKDPDIREQLPTNFRAKIEGKKSAGKIKKLQKIAERATAYPIIIIGDNIKDENNQVNEIIKAGGVGKWKLTTRLYVSGYWRIQWYGHADAKESKIIFIEPYYKGPELADVINKKYQVGNL